MATSTRITSTFLEVEGSLKSYLKRFLVRQQDVEDVVQETFARAYRAEQKCEIHSPKSFLFRVARNLALSELTRKSTKMVESIGDVEELNVFNDISSVSRSHEVDRSVDDLREVVESLPPQCRKVLLMRKGYGFSHKEISSRLGISTKTIEKHLSKALKRCHELEHDASASHLKPEKGIRDIERKVMT